MNYYQIRNTEDIGYIYPETAPNHILPNLYESQEELIKPFVTSIYGAPYSIQMLPAEVVGAICSAASRAEGDLREVMVNKYIDPFIMAANNPENYVDPNLVLYGIELDHFIKFLQEHPPEIVFANIKAREFFAKWFAEFGDDSIAQMAGLHLIYPALSQLAIKFMENQRQGIAFLEQSSRYVDFSGKVNGEYKYYRDPILKDLGLYSEYKSAMDNLFDTYIYLKQALFLKLREMYPNESERVLKTKVFDTIRGILPVATTGQVAVFGSGQAFEYLTQRSADYYLNEIGWMGRSAYLELSKQAPSFFRRVHTKKAKEYREHLIQKRIEVANAARNLGIELREPIEYIEPQITINTTREESLLGENKVIAGLLWQESNKPFREVLQMVEKMSIKDKNEIVDAVFSRRTERWNKVPRALELAPVNYEIVINIGAWRDIQRHRTKTQIRQDFTPELGFDVPDLLYEVGLAEPFVSAIHRAEDINEKIANHSVELAQYACVLAHRCRSLHEANLRSIFWEVELRTIPEGHPDYRIPEQILADEIKDRYPVLGKHLKVDMNNYLMARRGTAEKIKEKEERMLAQIRKD